MRNEQSGKKKHSILSETFLLNYMKLLTGVMENVYGSYCSHSVQTPTQRGSFSVGAALVLSDHIAQFCLIFDFSCPLFLCLLSFSFVQGPQDPFALQPLCAYSQERIVSFTS